MNAAEQYRRDLAAEQARDLRDAWEDAWPDFEVTSADWADDDW